MNTNTIIIICCFSGVFFICIFLCFLPRNNNTLHKDYQFVRPNRENGYITYNDFINVNNRDFQIATTTITESRNTNSDISTLKGKFINYFNFDDISSIKTESTIKQNYELQFSPISINSTINSKESINEPFYIKYDDINKNNIDYIAKL